jgi:hypothetical protein
MIQLIHNTITSDLIHIASSGTSYCYTQRLKPIMTLKDALNLYKKTIQLAKDKGVKVSYKNKTKKSLCEHYEQAETLMLKYDELYEEQLQFWLKNAKDKTSFSIEEARALDKGYDIRNEIHALFYNSTPLGKYLTAVEFIQSLHDRLENLKNENNATIYI